METEVVVVGAGPVGLALAGDLGWRGRRVVVLERGDGSIYQPRMDLVGIRTMEFCRRWGLVKDVEASPYPRDYPQDNVYLTALNGHELGRERFPSMGEDTPPDFSPQKRERCPQNMFDPILRRFATSFDTVSMRLRHEFEHYVADNDGVTVFARDLEADSEIRVRARYAVGCDGARSLVAAQIGASYDGSRVLTYTTNVIFRTDDFNALHDKAPGYRYIFIGTEGVWATIVAINGRDQWRMSIVGSNEPRTYTEEEVRQAAYMALGRPFKLEILSIVPWMRTEWVAPRYRNGRVFIAGDAAHVMSPTGGFGMNTGIGDAVDLSWKLDAVLGGWGGEKLLQSYEIERRPVAVRNVSEATNNLKRMLSAGQNPDLLDETPQGATTRKRVGEAFSHAMRHEWYTHQIHLGYRYRNSPVVVGDPPAEPGPETLEDARQRAFDPTAYPGGRAPHVWLRDGSSTLDLFGREFVLLVAGEGGPDAFELEEAARSLGVPLKVVEIAEREVARAYGVAFTLVRPDGHIAWHADELPNDPESLLLAVTGRGGEAEGAGNEAARGSTNKTQWEDRRACGS